MKIKKRDNRLEQLSFDKIIYRLRKLCNDKSLGMLSSIDPDIIAQRVVSSIYDGVTSCELDEEAARIAVSMIENLEYQKLASRIVISNLHKSTNECFSEVMEKLYNNVDKSGIDMPIIADDIIQIVRENKNKLNFAIDYNRDYLFDYFGFKTLEKSYLMKVFDKETNKMVVVERPQHMYMRVALGIHKHDIESALSTYNLISQHYYTHASPTIFNAGTRLANLSSCFHEDTIITTLNKGPIKIKDVEIGDKVITHKGNVKDVVQLHKNPLGTRKMYELKVAKTAFIKVTDNHKLWVVRENKTQKLQRKDRVMYSIEFVQDFLQKDGCELLSKEYKNIKTKLEFKCVCGKICLKSFENIYYRGIRCNDKRCIHNRKIKEEKVVYNPEWISVEDLQNGDYICIPNKIEKVKYQENIDLATFNVSSNRDHVQFETIKDDNFVTIKSQWTQAHQFKYSRRTHNTIKRHWKIDEDFANFIGIFYGDGHIMRGKDKYGNTKIRGIGITIHNKNTQLIDFCKSFGEKLFGIPPCIHTMKHQNIIQVLFNSAYIGTVFMELFGLGFNNKKIWVEMYKWDQNMVKSLLNGLVTTDGCITKTNLVMLQMSNVKFMRDLYYLLRNNNIDVSYGKAVKQRNGTQEHVQINIPKDGIDRKYIMKYYKDSRMLNDTTVYCKNQYSPKVVNGFKFLKFENKTELVDNLPEYVYTLGIEDDHSYNVEGIIAENCYLLGTGDSIEGIFKTLTDCAKISKVGGGIGVHISNIRAKGSLIRGTNGVSDGIIPMLKVYNETCLFVNQCLLPDVSVFSNHGIKKMSEVTTDDCLVTHDGTFKKVNEIIINDKKEEIYKIYNTGSIEPLKCTGIHDIYVMEYTRGYGKEQLVSQLDRGIRKPFYIEANKLNTNHIMGYPIPTYENDIQEWTPELCRFYGIMLGDGSICFNKNSNGSDRYQVTLNNTTKLSTKAFIINLLNKNKIHYWIVNECEICFTYKQDSINKLKLTYNMLYDKDKQKRCIQEVLYLPKNKISMILKGLFESDGCQMQNGIWFMNTSKELIQNVKYMFLRLGVLVSCHTVDKVGQVMSYNKKNKPIIMKKKCYNLRIPRIQLLKDLDIFHNFENTQFVYNYFTWNNIIWSRINKIEKELYEGKVYDFNMIDNHNYLTESGLVHNSGKRKGSFAMYVEPWHSDIMEFLELRKNQGHENLRARDLFYSIWTPDLFMKQVENDGDWYLMCPDECPGLTDAYGDDFEKLYWKYVEEKRYKRVVKAQDVWTKIMDSQIETGVPYIGYKDNVNKKCNQKNLGTIKSSNLCSEISLYSDDKQYAVCNLASVALPKYVEYDSNNEPHFNFQKLREIAKYIVGAMNKVIDHNHYPVPETHKSNMAHRPIGIGIQGLADVYIKMRLPFESDGAKKLNKEIFETLYYGCLQGSIEESKRDGPYSTYNGSPFSEGKLQFDLCKEFDAINLDDYLSGRWDWDALKRDLKQYGARNSMLIALMPTASTAQIMNNSEAFEPIDSCIFKRRVLSGEYIVINKYLVADLNRLGLWSKEMKDRIIALDGSIQQITEIPDDIKAIYKTVWELSMKSVIEQSRDRGVFVDQMQSMNLFMANPNYKKLTSMHFYAWKQHLKTGMYYLRSRGQSSGKFSVDVNIEKQIREKQEKGEALTQQEEEAVLACSLENPEACMLCSS